MLRVIGKSCPSAKNPRRIWFPVNVSEKTSPHCPKLMPFRAVVDLGGAQGSLHSSSFPGREQGPTKIPWQNRHGDASWSPKKLARTEGTMVATSINWDAAPIVLAIFFSKAN